MSRTKFQFSARTLLIGVVFLSLVAWVMRAWLVRKSYEIYIRVPNAALITVPCPIEGPGAIIGIAKSRRMAGPGGVLIVAEIYEGHRIRRCEDVVYVRENGIAKNFFAVCRRSPFGPLGFDETSVAPLETVNAIVTVHRRQEEHGAKPPTEDAGPSDEK